MMMATININCEEPIFNIYYNTPPSSFSIATHFTGWQVFYTSCTESPFDLYFYELLFNSITYYKFFLIFIMLFPSLYHFSYLSVTTKNLGLLNEIYSFKYLSEWKKIYERWPKNMCLTESTEKGYLWQDHIRFQAMFFNHWILLIQICSYSLLS